MNLLREEYCKEINTPMGLENVYGYVKWLEDKINKEIKPKNQITDKEYKDLMKVIYPKH
jgi:hypothetical protein